MSPVSSRGACSSPVPATRVANAASFPCAFQAYERRFPTCHLIPMFVASDVINEENNEDGSSHRVERRCALDVDAPRLLKRVSGLWLVQLCLLLYPFVIRL